jgi:hypothetical protein
MLKIWKQAWKREDPARSLGQGSEQELQLSGASSGAPSMDAATAAPPSSDDAVLIPAINQVGVKRRRSSPDLQSPLDGFLDRPPKISKIDHGTVHLIRDSLGNHLPEVTTTPDSRQTRSFISVTNFEDQVLDQARRENSAVFLSLSRLITS